MKRTYYRAGDWNAICDLCGRKFKASKIRLRWDGLRVCPKDYEERHVADFFKGRPDDQSVPWTRPEPDDVYIISDYIHHGYYTKGYMGDS